MAHGKPLGIVPGFIKTGNKPGQGTRVVKGVFKAAADGPSVEDNLTYNWSPDQVPPKSLKSLPRVMEGPVTVYTIFWQPVGFRTASNYQSVVNGFFQNVAHDAGSGDSPYDTDGQYFDDANGISDSVVWGSSTQDYTPFPKSGCTTPKNLGPSKYTIIGAKVCLSDAQIQKEVKAVADRMGWPHGPNVQFFMYTPHDVESCSGSDCSYSTYCAYHWYFGTTPSNEYIYANMPWPNQQFTANGNTYQTDCDSGEHPNGGGGQTTGSEPGYPTDADAADEVISVSSHENNEAITDPTGLGWWVDKNTTDGTSGMEDGDMCAWWWPSDTGSGLGGVLENGALYTNDLNGGHYFIQGEWSNNEATGQAYSGCEWGHTFPTMMENEGPSITESSAAVGTPLHGNVGDWETGTGAVYYYTWYRCNADSLGPARVALKAHNLAGAPGCATVRSIVTGTAFEPQPDKHGVAPPDDGGVTDTYTPTTADVGDFIFLCAGPGDGWSDGNYDCMSTDDAVKVAQEPELTDAADPTTWLTTSDGTFQPGSTVTITIPAGSFTNTPTSYSVQWQRCFTDFCTNSGKAVSVTPAKTGSTITKYTVQPADVAQGLQAVIVAKNKFGSSDAATTNETDNATGAPTATEDPSWTDESWSGGTNATLNIGTWTAPTAAPITSFTVTIYRCPSTLPIITNCETSSTQTVKSSVNGHTITYKPTAADTGYYLLAIVDANSKWSVSAYADAEDFATTSSTVGGVSSLTGDAPTVSVYPSLLQGYAIYLFDMNTASWTNSPTQFRYSVYRCTDPSDTTTCVNELGPGGGASGRVAPDPTDDNAALAAYVPSFDDAGYYIRFTVQAVNANGFSEPAWSEAGELAVPTNSVAPTITPNLDGTSYQVSPGTWDHSASAYENVIYTCTDNTSTDSCTAVDEIDSIGATSVKYTPADAFDTSLFVRVETFAMNDDSLSEGVFSDAVPAQGAL